MQWFTFLLLAAIFILSPFEKGLYFTADFYGVSLILSFLFILYCTRVLLYKQDAVPKRLLIILALPLVNILSLAVAESQRGAWDTIIRWTAYCAFFLLLYWSSGNSRIKRLMPYIFQACGIWLALFMLGIYYGLFDYRNAIIAERFAGVFQYPNTFGMIMGMYFLYSVIHLTKDGLLLKKQLVYSLPLVLFLTCFVSSYSRGMLLVLPAVWFAGLILLTARKQLEYTAFTVAAIVLTLFACKIMALWDSAFPGLLLLFLLMMISALIIGFLKHYLSRERKGLNRRGARLILPFVTLVLCLALMMDVINEGLVFRSMPGEIQDRIQTVDLNEGTAKERMIFLEDALYMSKESPFFGYGGEGWASVYKNYQQTPYVSNKIHNGYAEWLVNTGWIGFLVFMAVFGYVFFLIVRSQLREKDLSQYAANIAGLMVIFVHSFIDFNFSFGSVWFLAFWLLVLGLPAEHTELKVKYHVYAEKLRPYLLGAFALFLGVNMFLSYRYMIASQKYDQAKLSKSLSQRIELLHTAVEYHPGNIKYSSLLADSYLHVFRNHPDEEFSRKLNELAVSMASAEPRNTSVLLKSALLEKETDNYEKAIELLDKALSADHYGTNLYRQAMKAKVELAIRSDDQKAESLARSAIKDYEKAVFWSGKVEDRGLDEAFNSRDFYLTEDIHFFAALSFLLLNDFERTQKIAERYPANERFQDLINFPLKKDGQSKMTDYQRSIKLNIEKVLDNYSKNL